MKSERLAKVLHRMTSSTKASETRVAVDSFLAYMKVRGYGSLLPRILSEYVELTKSDTESAVVVTTAKVADVKKILGAHSIEEKAHTRVDETIVGGYTIETDSRFIDASHKNALLRLYQTLTR